MDMDMFCNSRRDYYYQNLARLQLYMHMHLGFLNREQPGVNSMRC